MENKRVRRGSCFLCADQHCTRCMVGTRGRRGRHNQFSLRPRSNGQAMLTAEAIPGRSVRSTGQPLTAVFRSFKIR
jgi:hypothetical protein